MGKNDLAERKERTKAGQNYGISLLKVIMCFEVLCCHFLASRLTPIWRLPMVLMKTIAVPTFMVVSFLLCRQAVVSGDTQLLRKRLKRLLWPQISWAVVYYLVCLLLNRVDGGAPLGFDTLLWQLFTGSSERLNSTMWFQTDLILLTLVFTLLFAWLKPGLSYGVILTGGVVSLVLQYCGVNYALFEPFRAEIKFSFGRIVEVWPFAAAAVCIFSPGLLKKMKEHWVIGCLFGLVLGVTGLLLKKPLGLYDSFGYAGVHMTMGAVGMVILFWCLPLEKLGGRVLAFIDRLSRYTLGIYCGHMLIAKIFSVILDGLGVVANDLVFTVALFAAAYLVSYLLDRTGKKPLTAMVR